MNIPVIEIRDLLFPTPHRPAERRPRRDCWRRLRLIVGRVRPRIDLQIQMRPRLEYRYLGMSACSYGQINKMLEFSTSLQHAGFGRPGLPQVGVLNRGISSPAFPHVLRDEF